MRAWEIENWQSKKLRRKCWQPLEYLHINKNGHWSFVDRTGRGFGIFLINYLTPFVDLMSSNDVEEYVEPGKACKNCGCPTCWYRDWPKADLDKYCRCWTAKKEEPVIKNCKTCANPCEFWLSVGQNLTDMKCWTDKKEEPVMEKSCANCVNKDLFSYCRCCIHGESYKNAKDHFQMRLPAKTKDLTWQEAYEAWKDGWEVWHNYVVSFDKDSRFTIHELFSAKYQLTGKRR